MSSAEIISVPTSCDDLIEDSQDRSNYNFVGSPPEQATINQIQVEQKAKKGCCKVFIHFCCEANFCSKMMGHKWGEQLRSFSFFINFFAVILIGFALGINELTANCGWNKDTNLDMSYKSLCTRDKESGYCDVGTLGIVWMIGSALAMIMNILAAIMNCQFDKYETDKKNKKRENNPLPKNCSAYLNLFSGLILVFSNILFYSGQDMCSEESEDLGSSLISTYAAGGMVLTF